VRFGALTGQAVQVLWLLREAFGVTFKIRQETHPVVQARRGGAAAVAGAGKRTSAAGHSGGKGEGKSQKRTRRHAAEVEESEDGSDDGSEGSESEADSGEDSEEEDEDGEEDGGREGYSDSGSEGSSSEGSGNEGGGNEGGGSDGSEDGSHSEVGEIFEGGASTAAAALERTTVLLSCYGIGYSNVYRRAT
jgi:Mg-chelatase subunit ChlI